MVPATLKGPALAAVVIGGSAGSVEALTVILPGLPPTFPPVLVVVHLPPSPSSLLVAVFGRRCAMRVCEPEAFEPIERGAVYFAPADYHLLVGPDGRCALSVAPPLLYSRPAIDVLFESAAEVYGPGLAGVVLSGASADGSAGLRAIHAAGGVTFVQDPSSSAVDVMPRAAIAAVPSARVLPLSTLVSELCALAADS
jgi:two-component system chemotaxis response regulator CheB